MTLVDLRSDTVTSPTPAMRRAMHDAEVGDDVYGEDPSVRALEERVASMFARQAAMFVPSGIMATQTILATLCPRGTEVVCESNAHVVAFEAGAAAIIANIQFQTIAGDRGRLAPAAVAAQLRPQTFPFTQTSAISVEEPTNLGGGAVHGVETVAALRAIADEHGVALHGDGARLFNAIVATGTDPADYGRFFTAFSICLSKGLGAPVGSVVVGDRDMIAVARSWRRRLGGAMRQAGVLATAGVHALEHHVDRLADDHDNAREIATFVAEHRPSAVDPAVVETNIITIDTGAAAAADVVAHARANGVLVTAMGTRTIRVVTHLDVDAAGCRRAASALVAALDELDEGPQATAG
ncbi:MAG: GntG family PLP-dependent aldolase [Nitriliruptoraceae bacterium]